MRVQLLLAIITASCSEPGAMAPATCQGLNQQIADALAVPGGSCETDTDCSIIGGQLGFPTCDCAPYVVNCEGVPIPNNAPSLSRVKVLIDEFKSGGCAAQEACDCGGPTSHRPRGVRSSAPCSHSRGAASP